MAKDDLTRIKGIGPATARQLAEAGIDSFADMIAAETLPPALEPVTTPEQWAEWRGQAATLVPPEKAKKPDEQPDKKLPAATRAVLVVKAKQDRRWRAGRLFGREPVELNAADLTEAEIAMIEADPVLITSREERPAMTD